MALVISGLLRRHWSSSSKVVRKTIAIPKFIGAKDLARRLKRNPKQVARDLCNLNEKQYVFVDKGGKGYLFPNVNSVCFPFRCAARYAKQHGYDAILENLEPNLTDFEKSVESLNEPKRRLPGIIVMGHVDHGKTTLLDQLSGTKIAQQEVLGITQKINVCQTFLSGKMEVTFLDTPGHPHFFRMRSNAASVGDLVLLVIAADEGIQRQTEESIGCIETLGLPVIVCVNKMDVASDQLGSVEQQIRQFVVLQDAPIVPISAKSGDNLNFLQQVLLKNLQSDTIMKKLATCFQSPVEAVTLEVEQKRGVGNTIRLLVKCGILKVGDVFVCGLIYGKVRALMDFQQKSIPQAFPGMAVDVIFKNLSQNQDAPFETNFFVCNQLSQAQKIIECRTLEYHFPSYCIEQLNRFRNLDKRQDLPSKDLVSVEQEEHKEEQEEGEHKEEQEGEPQEKNNPNNMDTDQEYQHVVIKADCAGSLATILDAVDEMPFIKVAHYGIGNINKHDVLVAGDDTCPIFGFKVKCDSKMRKIIAEDKISLILKNSVHAIVDEFDNLREKRKLLEHAKRMQEAPEE